MLSTQLPQGLEDPSLARQLLQRKNKREGVPNRGDKDNYVKLRPSRILLLLWVALSSSTPSWKNNSSHSSTTCAMKVIFLLNERKAIQLLMTCYDLLQLLLQLCLLCYEKGTLHLFNNGWKVTQQLSYQSDTPALLSRRKKSQGENPNLEGLEKAFLFIHSRTGTSLILKDGNRPCCIPRGRKSGMSANY